MVSNILSFDGYSYYLIIFLIIVASIYIFLFLLRKIFKLSLEYHSKDYWQKRYTIHAKAMDWYCPFEKIYDDFRIKDFLDLNYPNKNKTKILELGCGNSTLANDFYNLGYKNITSIDFSSVVIKYMKEKYFNTNINCKNLFTLSCRM
jgi:SAM-dependent methyltransferase